MTSAIKETSTLRMTITIETKAKRVSPIEIVELAAELNKISEKLMDIIYTKSEPK